MESAGGGGANAGVPWRRQGSGSSPSSPAPLAQAPPPPPMASTGGPPPPPPPPMAPSGGIPTVRLNSEIGPRESKGPPMALAGAMMKDKKPFTYTPGGIDLSEIRSPRMAKRIQVNAAAEGVSSTPSHQAYPGGGAQSGGQGPGGGPPPPPPFLPPAAMAAMNPSMAIPVLPQGGFNPQQLNRTQKPSDFVRQEHEQQYFQQPLYPTLPQQLQQQIQQRAQQQQSHPNAQHFASQPQQYHQAQQQYSAGQGSQNYDENRFRPGISTARPAEGQQIRKSPSPTPPITGTGSIYIAPIKASSPSPQAPSTQQQVRMNLPAQTLSASEEAGGKKAGEEVRRGNPSKVQARSQNLGSIYIPPIEQRPSVFTDRDRNPNAYNPNLNLGPSSPTTASSDSPTKTPQTPQTPQLNKAPTPWMNSYNKSQKQGAPTAAVTPSANVTPWGTSLSRNIPISIVRDDEHDPNADSSPYGSREVHIAREPETHPWSQPSQQRTSQSQPAGPRVIPIQIERGNSPPSSFGGRNIPIQIEGTGKRGQVPTTPNQANRPNPYNSPMSTYSPSNTKDSYQRQVSELSAGMDKLSATGDESPRMEPIQSKSFKVIQKIADDVDEGSLHKTSEPRFRGGHIPSRAFRALQNNLPASPGSDAATQDGGGNSQGSQEQEGSRSGGVTHHIPIRFVSPPPSGGGRPGSREQSAGSRVAAASQQQVVEPKKYVGGNIPSRSFKILQAMTAADDVDSAAFGSLTGDDNNWLRQNKKLTSRPPRPPCRSLSSTPIPTSPSFPTSGQQVTNNSRNNNNFVRSRTMSPSPTPRQNNVCTCCCNHNNNNNNMSKNSQYSKNNSNNNNNNSSYYNHGSNGYMKNTLGESDSEDYIPTSPRSCSPWPENYDPNYDPFAYMQWYYWWYYNYGYPGMGWNNYDYSQPGYPHSPWSQSQTPNPEEGWSEAEAETETAAHKGYYTNRGQQYQEGRDEEEEAGRHVPRIVIESSSSGEDHGEGYRDQGEGIPEEGDTKYGETDSYSYYREEDSPLSKPTQYEPQTPQQPYAYEYSDINNSESGCDSENEMDKSANVHDESEFIGTEYGISSGLNWNGMEIQGANYDSDPPQLPENTSKFSDKSSKEETAFRRTKETAPGRKSPSTIDYSIFDKMTRKFELFENDCPNETEEEEISVEHSRVSSVVGLVEEPDTVSSSEEDAPTLLADPDYKPYDRGVTIEECYSPPVLVEEMVEDASQNFEFLQDNYGRYLATRLSTIDELTERSGGSFSLEHEESSCGEEMTVGGDYAYEDEDDGNSSDEGSSVSVIENKSGDINNDWGHTTAGESHADEASSSSDADDENDDDPLLPTVTVHLPMKLSFSKSQSYRDIATLMVGSAQLSQGYASGNEKVGDDEHDRGVEEERVDVEVTGEYDGGEEAEVKCGEGEFCIKENVIVAQDYDEDEPVVSYTISLSRSTSKSCEKNKESDSDCAGDELDADPEDKVELIEDGPEDSEKYSVEEDWSDELLPVSETIEDDTDFWGEIKKTMPLYEPKTRLWRGDEENDFWNESSLGDQTDDNLEDEKELEGGEEEPETCVTVCEVREGDRMGEVEVGSKKEDEDDFWTKLSREKKADESVNFWDRGRTFESNRFSRQFSWECDESRAGVDVPIEIEILESGTECEVMVKDEEPLVDDPDSDFWASKNMVQRDQSESTEEGMELRREKEVPDYYDGANTDDETIMECMEVEESVEEIEAEVVEELENYMKEYESEAEAVSRIHEEETVRALHSHGRDSATYVSDENSDESTCTLADNTKGWTPTEQAGGNERSLGKGESKEQYEYNRTHSRTSKEIKESNVEVKETREKFKLGPSTTNHTSLDSEESPTEARPQERMTRAEDLLWRIERFLQESLSLGSEDDSGVMTDISRQLSDVDTDNDVETEVVLRNNHAGRVGSRSLKTRSMVETSTSTTRSSELYEKVDTSGVVMRNTSAEKKHMRYQRAKTHSRLFQLLQDECSRDEEEAEIDFENLEQVEEAIEKSKPFRKNSVANIKESIMTSTSEEISESKRSRLVPLPIKDFFGSSSVSVDSTSSSSGVLSPSSPVSRDRLLVDIINQFHQRHQSQTKKKVTNFPSKIFKLLQQEFGEEFYDTFDCCEDDFDYPSSTSLPEFGDEMRRGHSNRLNSGRISVGDVLPSCHTPTHGESIVADSSSSSCNTSKTDFLEVPQRRKKAVLARDPRVPKNKRCNF